MRPALSSTLAGFGTTIFSEMTRLANEHGAINLAQGFPDFDGPEFVKEAAIAAIRGGQGQYERVSGIPEMHRALAAKCRRDRGLDYAPDTEIVVTTGATEAIFAAIRGLCDAGDEVVLFEPYYDSYKASVRMAGAVAARRDAADARLELRPRRARGRLRSAHPGDPRQHAAQSDGQGLLDRTSSR